MSDKVILTCSECLSRNYTTVRNRKNATGRLELLKYCKRCGKHTLHKETKQEDLMADSNNSTIKKDGITTFFKGVVSEAKRIKWSKFSQLMKNTAKVLFFCILFALFFILCDFLVSGFLVLIGVGA